MLVPALEYAFMNKAGQVVSFLKPLDVAPGISDFGVLKVALKDVPDYTLLPQDFFAAAQARLPAFHAVLARGDWVQVGVWRGGGALFFRAMMADMGISTGLHLFDTFGRFPVTGLSRDKDRRFVRELGPFETLMPAAGYRSAVERLFSDFRLADGVRFHECDVNALPESHVPDKISLLHLDVDFYEPTLSALNRFYDRVIPGGLIIVDDYYMELLACREAVDGFLSGRGLDPLGTMQRFSSYSAAFLKPDS